MRFVRLAAIGLVASVLFSACGGQLDPGRLPEPTSSSTSVPGVEG